MCCFYGDIRELTSNTDYQIFNHGDLCIYMSYVDAIPSYTIRSIKLFEKCAVIFIFRIKWLNNFIFFYFKEYKILIISYYYSKEKKEYIKIIIKYIYLNTIYKFYIYVLRKISNITIARVYIDILVTQSAGNVRMLGGLVR